MNALAQRPRLTGARIRVVNYHNTPLAHGDRYEREFATLAARFAPVTEDQLRDYLVSGHWPGDRPGVIPAFYNGYRNNFDVARPLLEKHGLVGWFFAVTGWSDCPPEAQMGWGAPRRLHVIEGEYPDGRHAASWDELRTLDRDHVVASHTRGHTRVDPDDPAEVVPEILGAQMDFVRELGHPVRSFAWLLGGRYGENLVADAAVDAAGYEFLFSNLSIQRLPRARITPP